MTSLKTSCFCYVIAILLLSTYIVVAKRRYVVLAPRTVRPAEPYLLAVTLQEADESTLITAEISGTDVTARRRLFSRTATVQQGSSTVQIDNLDDLAPGNYSLTVSGRGGVNFQSTELLQYTDKTHSTLVQLDKSVYRPGDRVNFRVILVGADLRPLTSAAVNVLVTDGLGNMIREWKEQKTDTGVFSSSLQLSDQLVLGDWNVTVEYLGQTTHKMFQVAEYVLPQFRVSVDLPVYALLDEGSVTVTVHARYADGLPVRGDLMVRAYPAIRSSLIQPVFLDQVKKNLDIYGATNVSFDIQQELGVDADYVRRLVFNVVVLDRSTGQAQNATGFTTLYRSKYKLNMLQTSNSFKPGLKYTAFLLASTQDGVPKQSTLGSVTVSHSFSGRNNLTSEEYRVPGSGLVEVNFFPSKEEQSDQLVIEAEYAGVRFRFPSVGRAVSPSGSYMALELATHLPRADSPVTIRVVANVPFSQFTYHIISRGTLQLVQTVTAEEGFSQDFRFQLTARMFPRVHVLVFFTLEDDEVVAETLTFGVAGNVQNQIDVEVDEAVVEPGSETTIRVKTLPGSYIGLMAVDGSLPMLQEDNDITSETILADQDEYEQSFVPDGVDSLNEKQRLQFFWSGGATSYQVFQDSGTIVMTNGNLPQRSLSEGDSASSRLGSELAPAVAYAPRRAFANAGPFAFSSLPTPFFQHRRLHLLQLPQPTWIFEDIPSDQTSKPSRIVKKAPSEIGSWKITAFSIHDEYGLVLLPSPKTLRVAKQLRVTVNIPASVRRGEVVGIRCVVHNLRETTLMTRLTLEHQGDFKAATMANNRSKNVTEAPLQLYMQKQIPVHSGDVDSVTFLVVPLSTGELEFKVTAKTDFDTDVTLQKLRVKFEGAVERNTTARLLDLTTSRLEEFNTSIGLHRSYVNDSNTVLVAGYADMFGIIASGFTRLIPLPTGCGEQSVLHLASAVTLLDYLKRSSEAAAAGGSERLQRSATAALQVAYQRQLSYRRSEDHGFSVFGDRNKSGSIWLTALAIRWLNLAKKYVSIDSNVIDSGLQFLAEHRQPNGSFVEIGEVSYQSAQTVDVLTPLVLVTFLESGEARYSRLVNDAIQYLVHNLPDQHYPLAITAYALAKAAHPAARSALTRLNALAQNQDEMRWWQTPVDSLSMESYWYGRTRPVDIETTSYALLTHLERKELREAVPIVKWLVRQLNPSGGFISSQDTIVGIAALAAASLSLPYEDTDVTVRIASRSDSDSLKLINSDGLTGKTHTLSEPSEGELRIQGSGSGFVLVQISQSYNVLVSGPSPSFYLNPRLDSTSSVNQLKLTVCAGWKTTDESSNMAVMEVELPSGFTVDQTSLPGIYRHSSVQRVDITDNSDKLIIYFNQITEFEVCPTVLAYSTSLVAEQKRAAVVIYDYYDPTRMARQFYYPAGLSLCDICEAGDCPVEECGDVDIQEQRFRSADGVEPDLAVSARPSILLTSFFVVCAVVALQYSG